jgi:tetratricopeptide (TPR) repeat protein
MRRALFAAIFIPLVLAVSAVAELPSMGAQKWREDLRYFAAEAPKRHKNLFHTMTREQFDAAVRQLDARIPEMNDDQIVVELARIVAMIRDGHTYVPFGREPLDYVRMPLRFEILQDGIIVRGAEPKYAGLVGGKLLSIDGRSADEVFRAIAALAPRDNDMTIRSRTPLLLSTPALLHGLGLISNTAQVKIAVDKDGKKIEQTVASVPQPPESRHGWIPDPSWIQVPLPLYLQHPDDNYWYEYLPDSRTLYVQWNAIQNKKDEAVAHFFHRVFEFADTKPVERLVLDLRLNGGGNNYLNTEPIKAILRSPLNQRGKFFVLISPRTFSAAMNLTNILHKYSEAIWVGEPTGASPNSFGDPAPLTLPNSKIPIYLSALWWQDLDERDKRAWQAPDIAAEPTIGDFAAGRDPVMQAVLHWQNKPSLEETVRAAARRKDYPAIAAAYKAFRADPANKYADFENDFNNLGYEFLTAGDTATAIEVFKVNVEAYARSWNAYDSLGEAYMKAGQKELAITCYEKSLQLNPENHGGEAALRQLRAAK